MSSTVLVQGTFWASNLVLEVSSSSSSSPSSGFTVSESSTSGASTVVWAWIETEERKTKGLEFWVLMRSAGERRREEKGGKRAWLNWRGFGREDDKGTVWERKSACLG